MKKLDQVRFGIVGLGNQGSFYACQLFAKGEIKNGKITAMCDINPVKIDSMKEKYDDKSVAYFSDYREMFDSGLCDAILVEVPHYSHPEITMEALKRGLHVICDKPAGVYTKQVREMNEASKSADATFGMMFNQRTNCLYRKMREIITSGGIGELQRVTWIITNWYRTQYYYDTGSWRATWKGEGGGVLMNQCPHQIDLIQWVVGKRPTSVNGFCKFGQWHDIEVEDEVTAYLQYDNGATGVFVTTTGEAPGSNRLEVSGTKGKLVCEDDKLVWYKSETDLAEYTKTAETGFEKPEYERIEVETDGKNPQHAGIINNFIASLRGEEELFVAGTEGIDGVELMNAIQLSGWKNGETVTLPIDEDEFLRHLNEKRAASRLKVANDNVVAFTGNTFGSKKA